MYLRQHGNNIFVDTYAMEVYLPYDYSTKAYQGNPYYSLIGNKVRFYGVGNMRFYKTAKEMDQPLSVKTHALGIPMFIISIPADIDTRDVQFVKGGITRRCIVLTYYKDDVLCENRSLVQSPDNAMLLFSRIDGGKLDHVTPEEALGILQDLQRMNKSKLRVPTEEEEIYISERYRNPNKHDQKARFLDKQDVDQVVSYNLRQEMIQGSTYQATVGEDINTALIASVNRKRAGVVETPSAMERIVRGLDMTDLIKERDEQNRTEEA